MNIRMATAADMPAFFDHNVRHFRESGNEGDPLFHPVEEFETWNREEQLARSVAAIETPLDQPAWMRLWVCEMGGQIVAAALLRSRSLKSQQHRCHFAIGIERLARGQGLGRRLSLQAISWARLQPGLDWMDLWVFAHNAPAIALYEKLGFTKVVALDDWFRVRGEKIADLHMMLRLKP